VTDAGDLLSVSDERDMWERRLIAAQRAAYRSGYADGRAVERAETDRAWAALPPVRVPDSRELAEVEACRWHLCCRRCRLAGHRAGCPDCEDRARETFGQSHRDDRATERRRAA
jgi:hypothetical protein